MKALISLMMVLLCALNALGQTSTENYVETVHPRIPVASGTQADNLSQQFANRATTYLDGLGRPVQQVLRGQSPGGNDMVSFTEYDEFGRPRKHWLPYATNDNDGTYRTNAQGEQALFYINGARVARSQYPYGEVAYEASPLQRTLEVSAPGGDWQMGSGHTVKQHTAVPNEAGEVRHFVWNQSTLLANAGQFYPANELLKHESIDEHGRSLISYSDKRGRTILTKQQHGVAPAPGGGTQIAYLETYNVFDNMGRLVAVIPPMASQAMQTSGLWSTAALAQDWLYVYQYDDRGRMVSAKVPDAGTSYTVYDNLNRPILSQDARQAQTQQWSYVKYDVLGRVISSGLCTLSGNQSAVQALADQWYAGGGQNFEAVDRITPSANHGYTNQAFPNSNLETHVVNYYDSYDFNRDGAADFVFDALSLNPLVLPAPGGNTGVPPAQDNEATARTRGMMTGRKVKVLDANHPVAWLDEVTFYDDLGRVIQTQTDNAMGGQDISDLFYDFRGQLLNSRLRHHKGDGIWVELKYRFQYDASDRLSSVLHQIDNDEVIELSSHSYNEIGQLVEKDLGRKTTVAEHLQSVDFAYNIRGWMTHINNCDLSNDAHWLNLEQEEELMALTLEDVELDFERIVITEMLRRGETVTTRIVLNMEHKMAATISNTTTGATRVATYDSRETIVLVTDVDGNNSAELDAYMPLDGKSLSMPFNSYLVEANGDFTALQQIILGQLNTFYANANFEDETIKASLNQIIIGGITSRLREPIYNDDNNDLWGMKIAYNDNSGQFTANELFNGNISEVCWKSAADEVKHAYGYSYDALDRLVKAEYAEEDPVTEMLTQNVGRYAVNSVTYDLNGNIQSLSRNGYRSDGTFGLMDQLTYQYQGNQLANITEGATLNGINDVQAAANNQLQDYVYDVKGALSKDLNKGMEIAYNHLDMVTEVTVGNNQSVTYLYDGLGRKWRKTQTDNGAQQDEWYVGPFVYLGNSIEFISHTDGRSVPEPNGTNQYRQNFHYQDYLGNVRLAFTDLDGDGEVDAQTEIIQENDFYPFGLEWMGTNSTQIGSEHRWKHNQSELEQDFGIELYTTPFRRFDPQIARWHGVDALAAYMPTQSPYNGYANNPVVFVDPLGLAPGQGPGGSGSSEFDDGGSRSGDATVEADLDRFSNLLNGDPETYTTPYGDNVGWNFAGREENLLVMLNDNQGIDWNSFKEEAGSWNYVVADNFKQAESIIKDFYGDKIGFVKHLVIRSHGMTNGSIVDGSYPVPLQGVVSPTNERNFGNQAFSYFRSLTRNDAEVLLTACNICQGQNNFDRMADFWLNGSSRVLFANWASTASLSYQDINGNGLLSPSEPYNKFNFNQWLINTGEDDIHYAGFHALMWANGRIRSYIDGAINVNIDKHAGTFNWKWLETTQDIDFGY